MMLWGAMVLLLQGCIEFGANAEADVVPDPEPEPDPDSQPASDYDPNDYAALDNERPPGIGPEQLGAVEIRAAEFPERTADGVDHAGGHVG